MWINFELVNLAKNGLILKVAISEGDSLESVAENHPAYLRFLYYDANIGDDDRQVLEYFFEDRPDLYREEL